MYVVTGATGNVGRTLVRVLAGAGAPVTAVSRRGVSGEVPDGVRSVAADLAEPASLAPALTGARALFLHDGGAAHLLPAAEIVAAARDAGVRRIVLLSSLGVATRPESPSHGVALRTVEDAVTASGVPWTVLRAGGFASNALAWAESVRTRRVAAAPYGDVGLPVVDPDDIAEVAAAALREDGHAGTVLELTGPAPTTPRERAAAIARAIGEPVRFAEQTPDEALAQMLAFMPEPVARTTLDILGSPREGEVRVSPDVDKVLGRPARPFAAWAERNAAAFR
jgi:uncharacterized protein YbjT (DUF2867 family)